MHDMKPHLSMKVALALALGACGGAATPPAQPPAPPKLTLAPGDVAITDVTVVPMTGPATATSAGDGPLAHHTVVVHGDRIVAIMPSASVIVPAGATTIDGAGKWLLPGLSDMHVHTGSESDLTMFVAAGVTTVRNMFGFPQHLALRDQIAKGAVLGPTIVTAGPIIDGDPPVWPGSAVLVNPADADKLVAEQKAAGYDFLKAYSRLSREAYEALAAAAKQHGMVLAGHVPNAVGLAGVLAARQKSVEHLDGWLLALVPDGVALPEGNMQAKLRVALPSLDAAKLPGLIAQTIAAGTWNCPTLIVLDRMGGLDDPKAVQARTRWVDKLPAMMVAQWDPTRDFRLKALTAEDFQTMRAGNVWRARILAALAAANAPILVGTDTGNPYVVPGAALHDELELMIAAGMSRPRVLRAATAGAAQYLETPHEFGVVEAGARADLVLVSVDPLTEPLPLIPDGVMLRGRWLPRAELEAKLAEIVTRNTAPAAANLWDGVPALVPVGTNVHQARYDMAVGGKPVGQERLAVGELAPGKRAVVAQSVANYGTRIETSYSIGPDATTVSVKSSFGAFTLSGKLTAGKLVVTGSDATGKPVSLSAPLPAGGFLSGPGLGGSVLLGDKLAGVKVGGKRTVASLEISYYPATTIVSASYAVERKPDANGHRVFSVTTTAGKDVATGDLELDAAGLVVAQTLGPPLNQVFSRLPD
jgi:imidazolonepropionase-like amidohydrolase